MSATVSQITHVSMFVQPFVQAQIKENIKAPRHWPLWGNPPVTGGFPSERASDAENVSIWWRHHALYNYFQNFMCSKTYRHEIYTAQIKMVCSKCHITFQTFAVITMAERQQKVQTISNTQNLWWSNKKPSICSLDRVQTSFQATEIWGKPQYKT